MYIISVIIIIHLIIKHIFYFILHSFQHYGRIWSNAWGKTAHLGAFQLQAVLLYIHDMCC
jgi:hypothetical protein